MEPNPSTTMADDDDFGDWNEAIPETPQTQKPPETQEHTQPQTHEKEQNQPQPDPQHDEEQFNWENEQIPTSNHPPSQEQHIVSDQVESQETEQNPSDSNIEKYQQINEQQKDNQPQTQHNDQEWEFQEDLQPQKPEIEANIYQQQIEAVIMKVGETIMENGIELNKGESEEERQSQSKQNIPSAAKSESIEDRQESIERKEMDEKVGDDDDDFGEYEECSPTQQSNKKVEEFLMGLPSYSFMLEDRYY